MARVSVQQWAAKAERRLEMAAKKITMDAFSEVIQKSPVDTGRFRGNWQTGIGSKPSGTTDSTDKSGQGAINEAAAKVAGFNLGQTIYLVNNLPYAMRLEMGSSKQAPSGMVRLTAQRAQAIADKVSAQIASMP
jgi:hypothetical protein